MPDVSVLTNNGQTTAIADDELAALAQSLDGELLEPGDDGYDESRKIWNAMIDCRPALIARCATVGDVRKTVDFARDNELLLAIKGGGHNIAGNAVCDDGLMIDLSSMNQVEVDPTRRSARVGPGATLADFDAACQEYGLATPVGINSTTGIAGLTVGGGFGWLTRKHGLTVDNLRSADVVTADGRMVTASESENEDLFWGIRGGGGNLGIVTAFDFGLHPVGPEILSGLVVHPLEAAPAVLERYREFTAGEPDDASVWFVLRKAPPLPFLPAEIHGTEILILAAFWAGDMAAGERALESLRSFGEPIADVIGPHQYVAWQSAFDALLTPGSRNYWKTHNFTSLPDAALEKMVEYAGRLPSPQCEIFVGRVGGAASRVAPDATAYPHRDAEFVMNVHARWEDAGDDERCIGWAREFFQATAPYATGGAYVNFLTADEGQRIGSAYGGNYQRLAGLKRRYDPGNLFRLNQNVAPA